jgi:AcrR family transcriptional regulator
MTQSTSQSTSNLRVKRTRKLLRTALLDLVEERGFEALTVGEIAERAMVSRAGFYRYYQDKYDLVEQLFEEAVRTMMDDINARPHAVLDREETSAVPEPWVKLFEHFVAYERLYHALLVGKNSSWFVTKMRATLTDVMGVRVQQPSSCVRNGKRVADSYDRLAPALAASMLIEVITRWLEQGRPESPREIALRSAQLISSLLNEVGTWK